MSQVHNVTHVPVHSPETHVTRMAMTRKRKFKQT